MLALFRRHHHNGMAVTASDLSKMIAPVDTASRNMATSAPNRKGAFIANDTSAGHTECKITYLPCKTPVYTPSGWAEEGCGDDVMARSSQVPDKRLVLEFVYGYDGVNNTSTNVFYNCQRQVLLFLQGFVRKDVVCVAHFCCHDL